jgi:hypothetical protein
MPLSSSASASVISVLSTAVNARASVGYDRAKALYDKRKKPGDPEFHETLDEFLKRAEQPPDPKPVRALKQKIRTNALSTLSLLPDDVPHSAPAASVLTSHRWLG